MTGELGFEIYLRNEDVAMLWEILLSSSIDVYPIGLAARDTLRLEKGFCLYGNDIDETTSPLEAGLGWITDLSKDFIGSNKLLEQKTKGVSRSLVGIELIDKGIARKGHIILNENGSQIGHITSGTMSPTLNKAIAIGYLSSDFVSSSKEDDIFVQVRKRIIRSRVVTLPFVR